MDESVTRDENRAMEWELGLPSVDDLIPLSQSLIPPELAAAFRIPQEPCRNISDVNRAARDTLTSLQSQPLSTSSTLARKAICDRDREMDHQLVLDGENLAREDDSELRKLGKRVTESCAKEAEGSSSLQMNKKRADLCRMPVKPLKRPRIVWTAQIHKRFVDVVAYLGMKNAVPKTIIHLMNVEGLTPENVASHLQNFQLYLKRIQGLSTEGPSSADPLFASTPVPPCLLQESTEQPPKGHAKRNNVTVRRK